jgi:hypothetical protein
LKADSGFSDDVLRILGSMNSGTSSLNTRDCGIGFPIGDEYYAFGASTGERRGKVFGKTKRSLYVGMRRKRVHQKQAGKDDFNIVLPVNTAGKLKTRTVGKGDKMNRIPVFQKILRKKIGEIVAQFLVMLVHARRHIQ